MSQFLDKQGLTTYSNLIKGELDALDARIEALETGGKYLPLTGGTMSGAIAMGNNKITGLATPTANTDAATKEYVDSKIKVITARVPAGKPTITYTFTNETVNNGSIIIVYTTDSVISFTATFIAQGVSCSMSLPFHSEQTTPNYGYIYVVLQADNKTIKIINGKPNVNTSLDRISVAALLVQ